MSTSKGFTLVELLVVIVIIAIISTVGLTIYANAQKAARDSKRIQDLQALSKALYSYYAATGRMPVNGNPGGGWSQAQNGTLNPNWLRELVDTTGGKTKYIDKIPTDPNISSGGYYAYYDYGPGNEWGALFVTILEAIEPTYEGPYGSCRPDTSGYNWCSRATVTAYAQTNPVGSDDGIPDGTVVTPAGSPVDSSKQYCLCNPY